MTRKIRRQKKRDKKAKKRKKKVKVFFVYTDYTTEKVPRPFYVGKGNDRRVKEKERNAYWKNIANKYGWRRVIVLSTKSEAKAFKIEIRLIRKHKTFEADWPKGEGWGANLTKGGEGASGLIISANECERRRIAALGENNPMFGRKHSEETKQQISKTRIGQPSSKKGKPVSEEQKLKQSISMAGKFAGEKNPKVLLKEKDPPAIRYLYATGEYTQKQLSIKYMVSERCIKHIIYNTSWKISKEEHFALKETRKKNLGRKQRKSTQPNKPK